MSSSKSYAYIYKAIFYIFPILIFWFISASIYYDSFSLAWSLYDKKRLAQLSLITFSLICILVSRELRSSIYNIAGTNKVTLLGISALIILSTLSSFFSPLPIYAFTETLTFLGLGAVALVLGACFKESPKFTIFIVILATWIFLIINIVEFLTSYIASIIIDGNINTQLLIPRFVNIRFFNQFQIWLIPISLTPLLIVKIDRRIILYSLYLLAGVWITILIASQSRGAQIAMTMALFITYLIYRKASKQLLTTSSIVFGIGLSLYFLLFTLIPAMISFFSRQTIISQTLTNIITPNESSNVRIELWLKALGHIQEHPILGIGPMHYAYYPGKHAHPHNSFLQLCSEFGIPFCLLLTALLTIFIWKWIHYSRTNRLLNTSKKTLSLLFQSRLENNQQLWIILFFCLISGLIYSMVSGVLVMPMSQTMMFIIFGLMIGLPNSLTMQVSRISNFKSANIQILAGILLIGLLLTILPHLTTRILNPFFATYIPEHTAGPRYWELGGLLQQPSPETPFYYEHPALKESPKIDFN